MIQATQLKGTGVALITPFQEDKSVDFETLEQLIEYNIAGGVNYFIVLGTTSEAATLSKDEQKEVAIFIHKKTNGRLPLIIGMGGNNTAIQTYQIENEKYINLFDGILIAPPYYNKPNQEGIFQHYSQLATHTNQPIVLYNIPERTGCNITSETTLRLAHRFKNIIAIKEASKDLAQASRIYNNKPSHFELLSGDDALTLPLMSIGAIGVISVLANGFPKEMSLLTQLILEEKYSQARKIYTKLFPLMHDIFREGNPTGIKSILASKKHIKNYLRLPLVPASKKLEQHLKDLLEKM